jgi:hypothetical protein
MNYRRTGIAKTTANLGCSAGICVLSPFVRLMMLQVDDAVDVVANVSKWGQVS